MTYFLLKTVGFFLALQIWGLFWLFLFNSPCTRQSLLKAEINILLFSLAFAALST